MHFAVAFLAQEPSWTALVQRKVLVVAYRAQLDSCSYQDSLASLRTEDWQVFDLAGVENLASEVVES